MEEWVFSLSLVVFVSSFAGAILLSLAGSLVEKRMKDAEASERAGKVTKIISFILFLALGFSIVPLAIGLFFPLLQKVVPIDIGILQRNDMLFVFAAWAIYAIGLAILLPELRKDVFGSGNPDAPRDAHSGANEPATRAAALPPLDSLIREAGAVVLADTVKSGEDFTYTVLEVWKRPGPGFALKRGMTAPVSTKSFGLRGYSPLERQQVVFFMGGKGSRDEILELLPVVGDFVMYAPADTSVQEFLALGDLKKRVTGAGP